MSSQRSVHDRFWAKANGSGVDTCWKWTSAFCRQGYGMFWMFGGGRLAHRVAYELMIGEIPEGLDLDHLCHQRDCVNPWHLEPVTRRVNVRRGEACRSTNTECANGHPWTEETKTLHHGSIECRICARESMRMWRSRQAVAA